LRYTSCGGGLTEFEDGEDESHFPPPEEMIAGEVEDTGRTEDDHLVDGVLLKSVSEEKQMGPLGKKAKKWLDSL